MKKSLYTLLILVLASSLNAMFISRVSRTSARRALSRIAQSTQHTVKRSIRSKQGSCDTERFNTSAASLRVCIANPENFSFVDVQEIINQSLPNPGEFSFVNELEYIHAVSPCGTNGIIQHIVDKAVKYPNAEAQYADVLWRLSRNGWCLSDDCCKKTMLHTAVAHDLIDVSRALGACYHVHVRDNQQRTLLHHMQSEQMAKYLLKNVKFNKKYLNVQDCDGNTPLHLVPASIVQRLLDYDKNQNSENKKHFFRGFNQTPLRKAVADMDIEKCYVFFFRSPVDLVNESEYHLLKEYIAMRLFETARENHDGDHKAYREIASLLERSYHLFR